jgi:hypothetical protein
MGKEIVVTDQGAAALVFFKYEREGYSCFERDGFRVRVFFYLPLMFVFEFLL